jgi:archaellum component FlaC
LTTPNELLTGNFLLIQNQVQKKIALTIEEINEKINNVRGAVMMAYPMGLPEWDLVRIVLDEPIDALKVGYNVNLPLLTFLRYSP